MTGPEHFRMAEQLDAQAVNWYHNMPDEEPEAVRAYGRFLVDRAQLHATLALAAAAAELDIFGEGGSATGRTVAREGAWRAVLDGPEKETT